MNGDAADTGAKSAYQGPREAIAYNMILHASLRERINDLVEAQEEILRLRSLLKHEAQNPDIVVGDWIRFYVRGQFTIAEVRYIKPASDAGGMREICTDQGEVRESDVFEHRRKKA